MLDRRILAPTVCLTIATLTMSPGVAQTAAPSAGSAQTGIQGYWTNSSLTRLERSPQYGSRLAMTEEEVSRIEKQNREAMINGDKPTPVDAPVVLEKCDIPAWSTTTKTDCAYNSAWVDPGSTVMRVRGEPRTSFVTNPPDGRLPASKLDPAAARALYTRNADNPEGRSLDERCIMNSATAGPVMQPYSYNNNFQIVATAEAVVVMAEMVHDIRLIHLDRDRHLPSQIRPYLGDAIGHWEGGTLVVETTNFPAAETREFRGASEDLKVTERFTPSAGGRLHYQFEVSDPKTWAQSWSGEYEFASTKGPLFEYACHEGNYALPGILTGARLAEAAR